MPITVNVLCPVCQRQYQLYADTLGKKMRCLNTLCREVFEIKETDGKAAKTEPTPQPRAAAPAAAQVKNYVSGSIGDLVPFMTAESAEEPPKPATPPQPSTTVGQGVPLLPAATAEAALMQTPTEVPSWQQAPPVRRGPAAPTEEATVVPHGPAAATPPVPAQPPPWQQVPPPVRRPSTPEPATPPPAKPAEPAAAEAASWLQAPPPVRQSAPPASPAVPPSASAKPGTPAKAKPTEQRKMVGTSTIRGLAKPPNEPPPAPAVNTPSAPAADTASAPAPGASQSDAPRELAPGAWEPPPVRRSASAEPDAAPTADDTTPTPEVSPASVPAPATKVFGKYIIIACLLLMVGVGIYAAMMIINGIKPEEDLRRQAGEAFEQRDYVKAAGLYGTLARSFPESQWHREYDFYRDLCQLLSDATAAVFVPKDVMDKLRRFLKDYHNDPLLAKNDEKVSEVYGALIIKALDEAEREGVNAKNLDEIEKDVARIKEWVDEAKPYWPDKVAPPRSWIERISKLEAKIAWEKSRQKILKYIRGLVSPTLEQVEELARQIELAGFQNDPEIKEALKEALKRATPAVKYTAKGEKLPPPNEKIAPGLLVGPRVSEAAAPLPGRGVVFALARGVLYALAETDGHILWATRVGVDTTQLPMRLPATETAPEIALVLSADTNTLTARRVSDGTALWQHHLGAPCLGRPVVVERNIQQPEGGVFRSRRVYVPTVNGKVQEIEIGSGTLLGWYDCGLPLLVGGAREPETNLLYFPADRGFVFVLDVALQQCVTVLRTGHPSGALRGEPILVGDGIPANPGAANAMPRYLILCQTAGLEQMKLRAWELPIDFRTFSEKPAVELPVRGWSWFEPYADGEKIALATDAGVLGLFGIRQKNNSDPALFPLISEARKEIALGEGGSRASRAQVVHATENDFWVLSRGMMQHWRLGISRDAGLTAGPEWSHAVTLGSPLHAGQVNAKGSTVVVVTQAPDGQTCLATAVNAATGDVRWQRQLGLMCAAGPLALGGQVLAQDRSGALFLFDAAAQPHRAGFEWQFVQEQLLARPPGSALNGRSHLLAGAGGSAYVLSGVGKDTLLVRRYLPGKKPAERTVQELAFKAALAGTPALAGGQMVLPLADGSLARFALAKDSRPEGGPEWRAGNADAGAPGHVVHLAGDDFLFTDGGNVLSRISWPEGRSWAMVDKHKLQLPPLQRIVAAPLVVAAADGKAPPRVLVADASGTLTLLAGEKLQKVRSWPLNGAITAGPFLRGRHVGCVVDDRQLVWINPDADAPLWTYYDPKADAIIGEPQLVGERLVAAHRGGRLVSLDLADGRPRGKGYEVLSNGAPAAAPVAFGADRVFAPLTDGTVLLLPVEELEK